MGQKLVLVCRHACWGSSRRRVDSCVRQDLWCVCVCVCVCVCACTGAFAHTGIMHICISSNVLLSLMRRYLWQCPQGKDSTACMECEECAFFVGATCAG